MWGSPEMTFFRGRSELAVAAILAILAIVLWFDAATLPSGPTQVGPLGPRVMPVLVGMLLMICAVFLARDVWQGGHGEITESEDLDLTIPSDWRTPSLLVLAMVTNMILIERLGWVISGAILFWLSSYALGSRRQLRDIGISLTLSTVTFYGFYVGLGIPLPAGLLRGIL